MQDLNAAAQALNEALSEVDALFALVDEAKVNHKPTEKWSFGEEIVHLTMSTNGTAMLLSSPDERLLPSDHPSRTYDEIVQEYLEKLALSPNIGRAIADQELKQYETKALQLNFDAASKAALAALPRWKEDNADAWMVWKHPLLGKMTAREMVYFTVYHTRHHLATLKHKATS
jgi:hypothetical protein